MCRRFAMFLLYTFNYCFSTDHDGLFPKDDAGKEKLFDGKEGEWAVTIAEHLLTKLAVDLNYVMARYSALQSDCLKELTGKKGDTSFGRFFKHHYRKFGIMSTLRFVKKSLIHF